MSESVFENISDEVLRLHVIANSNSLEDQKIKLVVRDKILEFMNNNNCSFSNKDEAIKFVKNNLSEIEDIAQEVLLSNNFDYDVNVEVGNYFFPTKNYGKYSFPSGKYDALRVKIGKASGENWWCVMFPPLCFINEEEQLDEKILQDNLTDEAYNIICNDSDEIKVKFKVIEIIEYIKNKYSSLSY